MKLSEHYLLRMREGGSVSVNWLLSAPAPYTVAQREEGLFAISDGEGTVEVIDAEGDLWAERISEPQLKLLVAFADAIGAEAVGVNGETFALVDGNLVERPRTPRE